MCEVKIDRDHGVDTERLSVVDSLSFDAILTMCGFLKKQFVETPMLMFC